MKSQWSCLRQNLGEWHGSFTQCSLDGQVLKDTPSILRLEQTSDAQTIQLTLSRFPIDGTAREMTLSFTHPGPANILFFETGAFVQGSAYWSPFSQFGAEMSFVHGDRRLRFVQFFEGNLDGTSQLSSVTVIRETRADCEVKASPQLTVADLQGHWRGTAVSLSPSATEPITMSTDLAIAVDGTHMTQTLSYGIEETHTVETVGRIEGNCLWFEREEAAVRVVLLPGGGSIAGPTKIERDRSFFIESGWLIMPHHRQRLIRRYDKNGQYLDLTLVEEFKCAL